MSTTPESRSSSRPIGRERVRPGDRLPRRADAAAGPVRDHRGRRRLARRHVRSAHGPRRDPAEHARRADRELRLAEPAPERRDRLRARRLRALHGPRRLALPGRAPPDGRSTRSETDADLLSARRSRRPPTRGGACRPSRTETCRTRSSTAGSIGSCRWSRTSSTAGSSSASTGSRFPEGRRQLWEDIYFNVEAWRHADRVAVLADTPVYLWHSSATNNSKTYGPKSVEFWDRLDDLLEFIDTTLDGPEHAVARRSALLHQYRTRVLTRLSRILRRATATETAMALHRARAIQERYVPEEWDGSSAGRCGRDRSCCGRTVRTCSRRCGRSTPTPPARSRRRTTVAGREARLALQAHWRDKAGGPIGLVRVGDRLCRDLPPELLEALPDDVLDLTDSLPDVAIMRRRAGPATHRDLAVHVEQRASLGRSRGRPGRALPSTATAVLDPASAALGAPLAERRARSRRAPALGRGGARGRGPLRAAPPAPAMLAERTAVAYASRSGRARAGPSATLRNVLADGGIAERPRRGPLPQLDLPLPRIAVFAPTPSCPPPPA